MALGGGKEGLWTSRRNSSGWHRGQPIIPREFHPTLTSLYDPSWNGKTQMSTVWCDFWSPKKDSSLSSFPRTLALASLFWLLHLSEERVRKGAEKLQKHLNSKQQGRLDGFFTVKPKTSPEKGKDDAGKAKDKKADTKGTKRKVVHFILSSVLSPGADVFVDLP
jgi:hypothetical protein